MQCSNDENEIVDATPTMESVPLRTTAPAHPAAAYEVFVPPSQSATLVDAMSNTTSLALPDASTCSGARRSARSGAGVEGKERVEEDSKTVK
jgi:hypothetical protein